MSHVLCNARKRTQNTYREREGACPGVSGFAPWAPSRVDMCALQIFCIIIIYTHPYSVIYLYVFMFISLSACVSLLYIHPHHLSLIISNSIYTHFVRPQFHHLLPYLQLYIIFFPKSLPPSSHSQAQWPIVQPLSCDTIINIKDRLNLL